GVRAIAAGENIGVVAEAALQLVIAAAAAQDVVAVLAVQMVPAGATVDEIPPGAAVGRVVARAADQDVVTGGAGFAACTNLGGARAETGIDGELQGLAAGVADDSEVVGKYRERARDLDPVRDLDLDQDAVVGRATDGGVRRLRAEPGLGDRIQIAHQPAE